MSVKKWIWLFFLSLLCAVTLLAVCNVTVDPFGVFGDRIFHWYSYNMTQNPRVAKIAWLEQNHANYDSYIIGSSKASSLNVDQLNEYTGNRFYNMTWYGGDLCDELQLAQYIAEHYEVKNILLTIDPECASSFNTGKQSDLKTAMHCKINGEAALPFYARYLFCNLSYSWDKVISALRAETLPDATHVYDAERGCYNKVRRDATPINDLQSYLALEKMNTTVSPCTMDYLDEAVESIATVKELCEKKGIRLILVAVPTSAEEWEAYPRAQVEELWRRVAEITDFYSFSGFNSINNDLRHFYDPFHFRNHVGEMVLATIYGDETVYVPRDFGAFTTQENVKQVIKGAYDRTTAAEQSTKLAILTYHSFTESPEEVSGTCVLNSDFEAHLQALQAAGYQGVTYEQVLDYVEKGIDLPQKAVLITFDDGYRNNLTLAAPLLKQYGYSADIAVIGISVGKETYKDTGESMYPHFSLEEALPWVREGVLSVSSHSYDLHQVPRLDGEDCRHGVLQKEGESNAEYLQVLRQDYERAQTQLLSGLPQSPPVFTYPYGAHSELAEITLHSMGVKITVTTEEGTNQLLKGAPQSLYQLRRISVYGGCTAEDLIKRLQSEE